jgi:hypothetical protein
MGFQAGGQMSEQVTAQGPVAWPPMPSAPETATAGRSKPPLASRLSPADREALGIWALAYAALMVLAWASAWAFRSGSQRGPLAPFQQWEADWQQNIAAHGYFSAASEPHAVAFFPGFPLVLAAVHLVLRDWVLSELVVSFCAGAVAVVALSRLAGTSRAALVLVTMPAAVFLLVGYEESLFLALAVPAWLAARQGRWLLAGSLAAGAGLVRPEGVWLTVALAVMALTGAGPWRQRLASTAKAALGLCGPVAYGAYLWAATGTPWAWSRAQQAGWDLHLVTPWRSIRTTWWAAFEHPLGAGYSFEFQVELVAFVAVVAAAVCFGVARRWPEMTLCGLAAVTAVTQTWIVAMPRTLLVLFPVTAAIAVWPARARWAWVGVFGPLAVVFGLLYLAGQWAG